MSLSEDIRTHHELSERWRDHWAQVSIDLYGTVPDAILEAHIRKVAIEREPELWQQYCAITTELDIQRGELEVRMVEAHEWLKSLQRTES